VGERRAATATSMCRVVQGARLAVLVTVGVLGACIDEEQAPSAAGQSAALLIGHSMLEKGV